jgi:hypothetical protein
MLQPEIPDKMTSVIAPADNASPTLLSTFFLLPSPFVSVFFFQACRFFASTFRITSP